MMLPCASASGASVTTSYGALACLLHMPHEPAVLRGRDVKHVQFVASIGARHGAGGVSPPMQRASRQYPLELGDDFIRPEHADHDRAVALAERFPGPIDVFRELHQESGLHAVFPVRLAARLRVHAKRRRKQGHSKQGAAQPVTSYQVVLR